MWSRATQCHQAAKAASRLALLASLYLARIGWADEAQVGLASEHLLEQDGCGTVSTSGQFVRPDWSVVEAYIDGTAAWQRAVKDIHRSSTDPTAISHRLAELGPAPSVLPATAAANAILGSPNDREELRKAAEFLIEYSQPKPNLLSKDFLQYPLRGAEALARHFPRYPHWPLRMQQLIETLGPLIGGPDYDRVNRFIANLATSAGDSVGRATARYYTAMNFLELSDDRRGELTDEERRAWRQRALELATGLSTGIEEREFPVLSGKKFEESFAEVEDFLLDMIATTTLGGNVSNVEGHRLDGSKEHLSNHRGRVLFLHVWATWCEPCIRRLPDLREMAEQFGSDLQILGVSVDEDLNTVREFITQEPLPWEHWYVGQDSEFDRQWRLKGIPTYVLIDENGVVLNRYKYSSIQVIRSDVEKAVRRRSIQ